jgi:hypothetical protein
MELFINHGKFQKAFQKLFVAIILPNGFDNQNSAFTLGLQLSHCLPLTNDILLLLDDRKIHFLEQGEYGMACMNGHLVQHHFPNQHICLTCGLSQHLAAKMLMSLRLGKWNTYGKQNSLKVKGIFLMSEAPPKDS